MTRKPIVIHLSEEELEIIDDKAWSTRKKRAVFIREAALEKAKQKEEK